MTSGFCDNVLLCDTMGIHSSASQARANIPILYYRQGNKVRGATIPRKTAKLEAEFRPPVPRNPLRRVPLLCHDETVFH